MVGGRKVPALLCGAGLVLVPLLATGSVSSAEELSSAPVAFTLQVPADVDPGSIGISLEPDAATLAQLSNGESIELYRLHDAGTLAPDGTLTVRVDPAAVPDGFIEPNGIGTFTVAALGGGAQWSLVVSARSVRTAEGLAWTTPESSSPEAAGSSARLGATTGVRPLVTKAPEVVRAGPLVSLGVHPGDWSPAGRSAPAAEVTGNCEGPNPRKTQVATKRVWSTIGTTYPTTGSAATMQVDSSQGATYGIGASGSGAYGSWRASGSRTITGNWGFKWAGSSSSRSYRKEIDYRKYKYEYLDSRCDSYQWVPNLETGGVGELKGIERPSFWKCSGVAPGEWYRSRSDGKAYELGTAVKFAAAIGIDLSISRQYSTAQALKYFIAGSHKYLCGNNNDYPSVAGKLMERVID